jgi:hypothetical protein
MTRTLQVLVTAVFVGAMLPLAATSPASAASAANLQAPEDMMIDDMGGTLCSQYLEVRRYDPHLDKNFWNFALGLMGGLNMGRLLSGQDVRNVGSRAGNPEATSFAGLTAVMVQYCQLHPADSYAFGVVCESSGCSR